MPGKGETEYQFQAADGLSNNFHLKSEAMSHRRSHWWFRMGCKEIKLIFLSFQLRVVPGISLNCSCLDFEEMIISVQQIRLCSFAKTNSCRISWIEIKNQLERYWLHALDPVRSVSSWSGHGRQGSTFPSVDLYQLISQSTHAVSFHCDPVKHNSTTKIKWRSNDDF